MAVFRIKKNKNYTSMANFHFKDKTLSWKAKGILSTMLSLPDDWDYSLAGLATLANDGMSATRTAIKELEEHGYLIRKSKRENGKIVDWEYIIFENPEESSKYQLIDNPVVEKPVVENQHVENLILENQTQLNTKKTNTKKSNTDEIVYIVNYLNEKAGTSFRKSSKSTQNFVKARLKEGYTTDDFKIVIEKQCQKWKGTEFEQYLRPSTLFGNKFENYLNASEKINSETNSQTNTKKIVDLDENEQLQLKAINGNLGGGVVMLSDQQLERLLDILSIDEFNKYIEVVRNVELSGRHYKKSHYQAILDMIKTDRRC